MGLKDFKKLLEGIPDCTFQLPLSCWKERSVAVDLMSIVYPRWIVHCKNASTRVDPLQGKLDEERVWEQCAIAVLVKIQTLMSAGIVPILVMDGPPTEAKLITMEKRSAKRSQASDKANTIKQQIGNPLLYRPSAAVSEEMASSIAAATKPPTALINRFLLMLENSGFPVLYAVHEAEWVCAHLCRAGAVAAVYSADRDNLAHGVPVLITEVDGQLATGIILHPILAGHQLTAGQFVDLCIMLGTDYGERIYNVGPVKALALIKQYHWIENLPYDASCLNHLACREIFYPHQFRDICKNAHVQLGIDDELLGCLAEQFRDAGYQRYADSYFLMLRSLSSRPVYYHDEVPMGECPTNFGGICPCSMSG